MAVESISIPKKVIHVAGPSVFFGLNWQAHGIADSCKLVAHSNESGLPTDIKSSI